MKLSSAPGSVVWMRKYISPFRLMEENNFSAAFLPEARGRQGSSGTDAGSASIAQPFSPAPSPQATCSSSAYGKVSSICSCFRRIYSPRSPRSTLPACPLLSPPQSWVLLLVLPPVPQHCGGCCPNKLVLQTFSAHLGALSCGFGQSYKCRPFPFQSISHQGIVCIARQDDWGWGD